MQNLIVVNNKKNWPLQIDGVDVITAKSYLEDEFYSVLKRAKVYNFCRSYRYQSTGYYVSLLASARGHKPMPDILTIQDLKLQSIIRIASDELDHVIQRSLKSILADRFTLTVYFGKNLAKKYDKLSQHLFSLFHTPFLQTQFVKKDNDWIISTIQPIAASDIPDNHRDFVVEQAHKFFRKKTDRITKKETRFDLAMLVNPEEQYPPSNEKALRKFERAAEKLDFYVERITREDYNRLNEFDALFIRETTSVNHHTYRFARRAEAEGLVVIDDPGSIIKCTNKVYLAELLDRHKIRAPQTIIINPENCLKAIESLGFPLIIKQPDSSFSRGVNKIENLHEFTEQTNDLFDKSDLLIAQKFIPTSFDWRVGILNRKPLYVCKYHMARKHWQIYDRSSSGKTYSGRSETVAISGTNESVIKTAIKTASLIGDGLYGVDLKEVDGIIYVIEVNDNPSIDFGYEDEILKDELYKSVMNEILNRIEIRKGAK